MRVGDLVKHAPGPESKAYKIYEDWGHERDFKAGIIIDTKDSFAQVMPSSTGAKPAWYQFEELEILSERND